MELTCGLFVALVGLAAATPSGYGVKGGAGAGAVAKAEANAGAFASSGMPGSETFPTIPGATVSGSYSKSSASNFAASSSSAHSSSFSFSGSGVIPGNTPGSNNCQSGNCPNGNNGSENGGSALPGAGAAANSGAVANAGSSGYGSNTPCSNGNCPKPTCEGSNCDESNKGCTNGDCSGSTSESNDIAINTAGSAKSSYGTKSSTPTIGCSSGKCGGANPDSGSHTGASPAANIPSSTFTAPKVEPPCSSPNCASDKDNIYDKNRPSSYNVPILGPSVSHSGTINPNECASGNCEDHATKNTEPAKLPSYPDTPFVSPGSCSGSNCGGQPAGSHSSLPKHPNKPQTSQPSYHSSSVDNVTPYASSGPSCFGSACSRSPSSPVGVPSLVQSKIPGLPNPSQPPYSSTSGSANNGNNGAPLPFVPLQPTTKKSLPYTGGFGGPPGILKPNDFAVPSKITNYKPTGSSSTYNHHIPTGPSPPPCTAGDCNGQPNPVSPQQVNKYPSGGQYVPQSPGGPCTSGNCVVNPSQSPYQYKPSGFPSDNQYKPPSFNNPSCANDNCQNKPSQYAPTNSPNDGSYKPNYPCASGNCGSNQGSTANQYGSSDSASTSSSSTGCYNGNCGQKPFTSPQNFLASKPTKPSSGFGGPAGFLKPNENTPSGGPSSNYNPTTPSAPVYKPSAPVPGFGSSVPNYQPTGPAPCSFGNCGSQPVPSSQYNPEPSYKPTAPVPGFGAPAGVLKPNDYNAPSKVPTSNYKPLAPSLCSTGTCNLSPQYNPSQEYNPSTPTPAFGGPAGVLKPIDYNVPQNAPVSNYKPSGPVTKPIQSSCSFGNCGQPGQSSQYTPTPSYKPTAPVPEFGAPSGILKPNDYNAPSKVPSANYNPLTPSSCSSGNCDSSPQYNPSQEYNPSTPTPEFGGAAGVLKPDYNVPQNAPVSNYKPIIKPIQSSCSFGNCVPQPGPSSQYNPTPSYKPTTPVLGFGAPSGVLKPNDYNAPSKVPTSNYKPSCSTGNCDSSQQYNPSQEYNPSTPTPEFGGPAGVLKPVDYNVPNNAPVPSYNPSGPVTKPIQSSCSFGNCGLQPGPSSQYNPAPSYKPTAPIPGFGAPPGVLKPNDYNAPSPTPCSSGICGSPTQSSKPNNAPSSGPSSNYNPTSPNHSPSAPVYKPSSPAPGFGSSVPNYQPTGPAPCSSGNCGSQQGPSSQYNPAPSYKPTAPVPGFGAPSGVLKPNDYNAPSPCSSGNCRSSPQNNPLSYQPSAAGQDFGGQSAVSKPGGYYSSPSNSKPNGAAGSYGSAPCVTGNCGNAPTGVNSAASAVNSYGSACTSGNCGAQPSYNSQSPAVAYSGASAVASAKAVAYTGGFGGPPGLLKPFDGKDGNLAGNGAQGDSRGFYAKSLGGKNETTGSGNQAGAAAGATAGSAAGSHSGNNGGKKTEGCSGGCGGSGSSAGTSAKSVATAGAGAHGLGGSFASSSASAHASATAGAATKGGYGR